MAIFTPTHRPPVGRGGGTTPKNLVFRGRVFSSFRKYKGDYKGDTRGAKRAADRNGSQGSGFLLFVGNTKGVQRGYAAREAHRGETGVLGTQDFVFF